MFVKSGHHRSVCSDLIPCRFLTIVFNSSCDYIKLFKFISRIDFSMLKRSASLRRNISWFFLPRATITLWKVLLKSCLMYIALNQTTKRCFKTPPHLKVSILIAPFFVYQFHYEIMQSDYSWIAIASCMSSIKSSQYMYILVEMADTSTFRNIST